VNDSVELVDTGHFGGSFNNRRLTDADNNEQLGKMHNSINPNNQAFKTQQATPNSIDFYGTRPVMRCAYSIALDD